MKKFLLIAAAALAVSCGNVQKNPQQWEPLLLQRARHWDIILAERKKARIHNLCQYCKKGTCPCTCHCDGRILRNPEGTLWPQTDKRPNQEDWDPDYLFRHPHGKCSTISKEDCRSRTLSGCITTYCHHIQFNAGTTMSRRYRNHIKIYKTQNKRLTRATSNGIPSPTDIKFFELNDIP